MSDRRTLGSPEAVDVTQNEERLLEVVQLDDDDNEEGGGCQQLHKQRAGVELLQANIRQPGRENKRVFTQSLAQIASLKAVSQKSNGASGTIHTQSDLKYVLFYEEELRLGSVVSPRCAMKLRSKLPRLPCLVRQPLVPSHSMSL